MNKFYFSILKGYKQEIFHFVKHLRFITIALYNIYFFGPPITDKLSYL